MENKKENILGNEKICFKGVSKALELFFKDNECSLNQRDELVKSILNHFSKQKQSPEQRIDNTNEDIDWNW